MTTDDSKKIVLPPFLIRRLEAFRIVKGSEISYVVRDKLEGKTYDFDAWQFFILEVLPGCETLQKLQTVFQDRFDREITRRELEQFLGSLADAKLLDEQTSAQHPLLVKYTKPTFEIEDGEAKQKRFSSPDGLPPDAAAEEAPAAETVKPAAPPKQDSAKSHGHAKAKESPESEDGDPALGMNWPDPKIKLYLGDPRPILRWLAPLCKPLWRVIYLAPLMLLGSVYFILYRHFDLYVDDFNELESIFLLPAHLIFAWLTVHFFGSVSAAIAATNYKVSVEKVGFYPTFGFMPRWCLKMTGADRMTRKQMMWTHSAPLFMRIVLLTLGIAMWWSFRGSRTDLAQIGMLVTFTCVIGLTLEAGNPLLKAHAYYIVCAYLNEPNLRGKAYMAIVNRLRGDRYQAYDRKVLAIYGILTITWIAIVTLVIAHMLAKYLLSEINLGGSGLIIIAAFVAYMFYLNYRGFKKFGEDYERKLQFDRWRSRALPIAEGEEEGEVSRKKRSYWKPAVLICLFILLFVPYSYEPSGTFTIYPVVREDLTTDTPGVITEVNFEGGEFVKKGTVLARLAHDNYVSQYNVLTAQIKQQEHVIENLKTLPKPEDVQVAQAQLEIARTREPFNRAKAERLLPLWKSGAVTYEEYINVVKDHAVDVQDVIEKQANLALVKTGPTQEQIAAEEAKLLALEADRDGVQGKIDRTYIRMPFDGNILTLHLQDKLNSYLEAGKPFASVENTGFVTLQIQIQESDLQFVKVGMEARARPNSWFLDEFSGKVTVIDPDVTNTRAGTLVNVVALFDNHDGRLKTGMSGEAKLGSVKLPVWQAFTLTIERFWRVTVWSWIP